MDQLLEHKLMQKVNVNLQLMEDDQQMDLKDDNENYLYQLNVNH
jgi:hypothetical protein